MPGTGFATGIFDLIDKDSNGLLSFAEFAIAIVTICLFEKPELLKFCFFMFDREKNGFVTDHDLEDMMKMLHDMEELGKNERDALEHMWAGEAVHNGKVTFEQFISMNETYPRLLAPAFKMQHAIEAHTFGRVWWRRKREALALQRVHGSRVAQHSRVKALYALELKRRKALRSEVGKIHASWANSRFVRTHDPKSIQPRIENPALYLIGVGGKVLVAHLREARKAIEDAEQGAAANTRKSVRLERSKLRKSLRIAKVAPCDAAQEERERERAQRSAGAAASSPVKVGNWTAGAEAQGADNASPTAAALSRKSKKRRKRRRKGGTTQGGGAGDEDAVVQLGMELGDDERPSASAAAAAAAAAAADAQRRSRAEGDDALEMVDF